MHRNLPTGDIILIARADAPRNPWMIGKVIKTFPYKSGIARSVHTQTSTYLQILLRPVTKLFAQHVNKNSLSYQRIYSQYVHILPFSGQGWAACRSVLEQDTEPRIAHHLSREHPALALRQGWDWLQQQHPATPWKGMSGYGQWHDTYSHYKQKIR